MLFQILFTELNNSQYFFSYGPSKMTSSMHFLWRAETKIAKKHYFIPNATPPTNATNSAQYIQEYCVKI